MPLRDLIYRIRARDDTQAAFDEMEANARRAGEEMGNSLEEGIEEGTKRGVLRATQIIGSIASLLNELAEQQAALFEGQRALIIASGEGTDAQQAALAEVVRRSGLDTVTAAEGVAFASSLGFVGDELAEGALVGADLLSRGVSRTDLGRSANVFGLDTLGQFTTFGTAGVAAAQAANVDPGEFFGEFRDSATTFLSAGFDVYESLALQQQAYESGTVSEVQALFEQVLARATETGVEDPRTLIQALFRSVQEGDRQFGLSLLEPLGGQNLLDPIRSGALGLDDLTVDVSGDTATLGQFPLSFRGQIESFQESVALDPESSAFERVVAGATSFGIPGTALLLGEEISLGDLTSGVAAVGTSLPGVPRDALGQRATTTSIGGLGATRPVAAPTAGGEPLTVAELLAALSPDVSASEAVLTPADVEAGDLPERVVQVFNINGSLVTEQDLADFAEGQAIRSARRRPGSRRFGTYG